MKKRQIDALLKAKIRNEFNEQIYLNAKRIILSDSTTASFFLNKVPYGSEGLCICLLTNSNLPIATVYYIGSNKSMKKHEFYIEVEKNAKDLISRINGIEEIQLNWEDTLAASKDRKTYHVR